LSPSQFLLAGIFNFKESGKLKEGSLYYPMDFYRAQASSFSPVFSILKSLKNLKKTLSGSYPPYLFIYMETPPKKKKKLPLLVTPKIKKHFIS
jgi:hypothetical protein